jgi:hypothetical protein
MSTIINGFKNYKTTLVGLTTALLTAYKSGALDGQTRTLRRHRDRRHRLSFPRRPLSFRTQRGRTAKSPGPQEDVSEVGDGKIGQDGTVRHDSPTPGLNTCLSADTKRMDPEIKRKLLEELRNGPKAPDPVEAARKAAANARRQAFQRGLDKAVKRGDGAAEEKYREAIRNLGRKVALPSGTMGTRSCLRTP